MALLTGFQKLLGFEAWGALGKPGDPDPLNVAGIYRRRPGPKGITIVKMDFYDYVITHTEEQQAWRDIFADSVLAWQDLTEEEKEEWNEKAKELPFYGFNLFMREYLLAH